MKKKLKVKKAFSGALMKAAASQGRRVIRPGMQQPIPRDFGFGSGPIGFPRGPINPNIIDPVRPGMQQPIPRDPGYGSGPIQQPFSPQAGTVINPVRQPVGMGPLPNNFGPMQPVPAMKKGGAVRGGRKEVKGLRPAKLS